ncbi:MAG: glutathione peroxidase [Cyclobacteriaceae bacterium]
MKLIAVILTLTTMLSGPAGTIYDFKINSLDGTPVDFKSFNGKTLLIVNTASKCGYTPQYADLQKLHEQYGDKVTILGFPANNFGAQEPGSSSEIKTFCSENYGVSFMMFEKISVKGTDQHPLYSWLKEKSGSEPTWNFCKYIVKPDGSVKFFPSRVKPMDEQILKEL